jgi:hypothetical protein
MNISILGIDLSLAAAGGERCRRLFEPSRPQPAAGAEMAAKFFYLNRLQLLEESRFGKINASKC